MSRETRERRAFRVVAIGGVLATGFVVTTILWVAGVVNDHPPIVLFILTVIMLVRFRMLTGKPR
jgi:hypothetical protein